MLRTHLSHEKQMFRETTFHLATKKDNQMVMRKYIAGNQGLKAQCNCVGIHDHHNYCLRKSSGTLGLPKFIGKMSKNYISKLYFNCALYLLPKVLYLLLKINFSEF